MFKRAFKSLLFIFPLISIALTLSSCSKNPVEDLKLEKSFENTTFMKDGIEEMTVASISDGDTALFRGGNMSYNCRFYGINTPESTWQIEKWGKTASNFTKDKLNNAESIVIEGATTPPETETNGRWLAFVWYKPSDADRYFNLNLEIVRNGFSTSSVAPDHAYYDYFENAAKLAEKEQLAIYSDKEDVNFDETLEKVSLKDIALNPESFDQSYVSVDCIIKSQDDSDVVIYDIVDGVVYEFPVYLGYGSLGDDSICRPGNRSRFVGRVSSHNNNWQLTGIEVKLGEEETTKTLVHGYLMNFGKESLNRFYNYNSIKVTNVTEDGTYYLVSGTTSNLKLNNVNVTLKVKKDFNVNVSIGDSIIARAYNTAGVKITPDAQEFTVEVLNENDIRVI